MEPGKRALRQFLAEYRGRSSEKGTETSLALRRDLANWFSLLDGEPSVAGIVHGLEADADLDAWERERRSAKELGPGGGVESAPWPEDERLRLGIALGYFRKFSSGITDGLELLRLPSGEKRFYSRLVELYVLPFQQELEGYLFRWLPFDPMAPNEEDCLAGRESVEIVLAARVKMLAALDDLEMALSLVQPTTSLIGGNHPPEDIGLPPYSERDDAVVRVAMTTLRTAPPSPAVSSSSLEDAAETLQSAGTRITSYLAGLGDAAAKKFAEEFGKAAGVGVVGLSAWAVVGGKLLVAAQAAFHWIEAIRHSM